MSPATAIPPAPNSREYFSSVNVLVFALGNRGGEDLLQKMRLNED